VSGVNWRAVRPYLFRLDGHTPVPMTDFVEWGRWMETADRRVAQTRHGDVLISTVFLGIDHSHGLGPRPMLFETMAFFGDDPGELVRRYETWEDAEAGHAFAVGAAHLSGPPLPH